MAIIEEVHEDEVKVASTSNSDTDGEMPTMTDDLPEGKGENNQEGEDATGGLAGSIRTKQSKNEKKARSILSKLNLKLVPDVMSVKIRKNRQTGFTISKPEVYKCLNSDTYIIFGDMSFEDLAAQTRSEAAEKLTQKLAAAGVGGFGLGGINAKENEGKNETNGVSGDQKVETYVEEEEGVDNEELTSLQEKDVELVIAQTQTTRLKAIQALKKSNWDVVEAIMNLAS